MSLPGQFVVYKGRIIVGGAGDSRQHRRFSQGQLAGAFLEIMVRRRLNTVSPVRKINLVEIHLQNLILGKFPFHLYGQPCFLQLTDQGFFTGKISIFDQLLRYGAPPLLCPGAPAKVRQQSPTYSQEVNTKMFVKPLVFYGNKGLPGIQRNFFQGNFQASLRTAKGGYFMAITVINAGGK